MSRFPTLRTILGGVIAATLASQLGCACPGPEEQTLILDFETPKLHELTKRCELESDCEPLCRAALDIVQGPGTSEGAIFSRCEMEDNDDGIAVHYAFVYDCSAGRRPHGLCSLPERTSSPLVGEWFARAAHLEAAAVHEFLQIARDLRAHGADEALTRRAVAAARDEIQHTFLTAALARRYGARAHHAKVRKTGQRTLVEFATDNAVEGCVHETFAALLAGWQAHASHDPIVRTVMSRIADDEMRHAELSRDIDAWLKVTLPKHHRATIDAARSSAIAALAEPVTAPSEPKLTRWAGLPSPAQKLELLNQVAPLVWT